MPQQAVRRGLLEGFSQLASVFIEASQTLSFNFSIARQKKIKTYWRIYRK
jgi:hypothetical protein